MVLIGMTPFEARLAGGAFAYKVVADKTKWSEQSDPLKVMWAQSMQADDSEIWMTFKNLSQFPGSNDTVFRVYFERGRAVKGIRHVEIKILAAAFWVYFFYDNGLARIAFRRSGIRAANAAI
jgi:hypothetical protein